MNWRRAILGLSVAVLAGAGSAAAETPSNVSLPTTRQAPDEFGTQDYTVTVVYAGSFAPQQSFSDYPIWGFGLNTFSFAFQNPGGGCLSPGNVGDLYATANIPSGAIIDFIGLETATGAFAAWGVDLVLLGRYNGQTVIGSVNSTVHGFDTDYNAAPLGFQLTGNVHNALVVHVQQAGTDQSCSDAFAWVEIWWRRQVSPAPDTPSFNDVPATDFGYQYIEALLASGITGGCGGDLYCPDAPLTRRQMAIFLSKALGLHWPY
jgi:hypothetical protein